MLPHPQGEVGAHPDHCHGGHAEERERCPSLTIPPSHQAGSEPNPGQKVDWELAKRSAEELGIATPQQRDELLYAETRKVLTQYAQTSVFPPGYWEILNKIVEILKSYPGSDEVRLNIVNGGDAIPLQLPNLKTVYGPELEKRLEEVVEEGSYRVETIA